MQHTNMSDELKSLTFDFFYWFSRFEFALKEGKYLKNKNVDAKAEVDWRRFVEKYQGNYVLSVAASALIAAKPELQIVVQNESLGFREAHFHDGSSDLHKVTCLMNIVRNNLFHGGKHDAAGWQDPCRMRQLLPLTLTLLQELAVLGEIETDFNGVY